MNCQDENARLNIWGFGSQLVSSLCMQISLKTYLLKLRHAFPWPNFKKATSWCSLRAASSWGRVQFLPHGDYSPATNPGNTPSKKGNLFPTCRDQYIGKARYYSFENKSEGRQQNSITWTFSCFLPYSLKPTRTSMARMSLFMVPTHIISESIP